MRVCATYGSDVPLKEGAEMHEIRLDVFDTVPDGIGSGSIITLCGKDIGCIPGSFKGLVDVGDTDTKTDHRKIRSVHDYNRTPDAEDILRLLDTGDQEISKGAFAATSFKDLASLLDASELLKRRHVLLCMGNIGKITRIRQDILNNEFTFGYVGESTAPGQLSYSRMIELGDDCTAVGIIGHPLSHSKSPKMQEAAMRAAGIKGTYLKFDSDSLDRVEDVIRGYDIRGANVTIPYKERIIEHIDTLSPTAEVIGAVNTIVNIDGELRGENTDVIGIVDATEELELKNRKVLIMGTGGAAKAAAYAFMKSECSVSIAGRNQKTLGNICRDFGAEPYIGTVRGFDLIVNCTPIGLVGGEYPADTSALEKEQTVFDMVYGRETPLLALAKNRGCRTMDGEDMLVGQGAASFRLWFGKEPNKDIMRSAIR